VHKDPYENMYCVSFLDTKTSFSTLPQTSHGYLMQIIPKLVTKKSTEIWRLFRMMTEPFLG
jgi:hypothetical protein